MTSPKDTTSTTDFLNSLTAPGRQAIAIPLDEIRPDPNQPRKSLSAIDGLVGDEDQKDLELLADDIAENGLHQPITVKEMPDGDYQIVMGERRWRAMKLNRDRGLPNSSTIDAFVRQDLKGSTLKFAQLAENLQRKDLTELETATFFKNLLDDYPELQKQQLAKLLKKPNAYITRILSLLDPEWAHVVDSGIITYASLLEQFKALPPETRENLVQTAKQEERSLTSGDLRKARDTAKAKKAGAGADTGQGSTDENWPFKLAQQGGKGLTKELVEEVAQFVASEARPNENYQYRASGTDRNSRANVIVDTGGDATIPSGAGALNSALLNDKRELKLSMDQFEVLLRMDCFDTKGHMISTMLPVEELRNAILQLGGDVPVDDHQLVTALISRINELNT